MHLASIILCRVASGCQQPLGSPIPQIPGLFWQDTFSPFFLLWEFRNPEHNQSAASRNPNIEKAIAKNRRGSWQSGLIQCQCREPVCRDSVSLPSPWKLQQWRICLPMQERPDTQIWFLKGEDPLEEEMATHSSILAWEIPWAEEPGGLQSMGSQRVRHRQSMNGVLDNSLDFYVYFLLKYSCLCFF